MTDIPFTVEPGPTDRALEKHYLNILNINMIPNLPRDKQITQPYEHDIDTSCPDFRHDDQIQIEHDDQIQIENDDQLQIQPQNDDQQDHQAVTI